MNSFFGYLLCGNKIMKMMKGVDFFLGGLLCWLLLELVKFVNNFYLF